MSELSKSCALVIGGGTGLGLAGAKALAERGWSIFLSGRRDAVLGMALSELPEAARGGYQAADAGDFAAMQELSAAASHAMGRIDAVVISSGMGAIGGLEEVDAENFMEVLRANVLPVAMVSRAVLPYLSKGASITAIASIAATVAHERRLAYSTAKAAVIGMVKQMALDLAPRGIRVNSVSPSLVLTDLSRGAISREPDPEAALAKRLAQHPLGRLGKAEEIGEAIAYIAGPTASWTTGIDLVVDGGLSL